MNDPFKSAAYIQALKSRFKFRVGAVVVRKSIIVGKGFNKVYAAGYPDSDSSHAELEALNNTTARYRSGSVMFVCRVDKNGNQAYSKPCSGCEKVMRKMGVKSVWFSTEDGWEKMVL